MKNNAFILICFLFIAGCSTAPHAQRNPSSQPVITTTLPGEFFHTSIPFPSREQVSAIFDSIKGTDSSLTDGILNGLGHDGRGTQRTARTLGLNFCREKGFHNVAVVFWGGKRLTGAHCIGSDVSRKEILRDSYATACHLDKIRKRVKSCALLHPTEPYIFSQVTDESSTALDTKSSQPLK